MSNTWLFFQLYDMIVSRIVFLIPQIQDFFDLPIQLRQRGVFMRKLGGQGQKWLKCLHLICVCFWVGGAITMTLMNFVLSATDGMELYGLNTAKLFVDYYIIIPGANGCLLTGILYAIFTRWGWFRHRWIVIKWIITLYGMIFGTFWLGPWLVQVTQLSKEHGLDAIQLAGYAQANTMLLVWGTFQCATLLFALCISILKPWKPVKPVTAS